MMVVLHGVRSLQGFNMECVCGLCLHWGSEECDECDCCIELHKSFASDKHKR